LLFDNAFLKLIFSYCFWSFFLQSSPMYIVLFLIILICRLTYGALFKVLKMVLVYIMELILILWTGSNIKNYMNFNNELYKLWCKINKPQTSWSRNTLYVSPALVQAKPLFIWIVIGCRSKIILHSRYTFLNLLFDNKAIDIRNWFILDQNSSRLEYILPTPNKICR
jgi:hypothetical protein